MKCFGLYFQRALTNVLSADFLQRPRLFSIHLDDHTTETVEVLYYKDQKSWLPFTYAIYKLFTKEVTAIQELTAYFSPSRRWDSIVVSLLYFLKEKVSLCGGFFFFSYCCCYLYVLNTDLVFR